MCGTNDAVKKIIEDALAGNFSTLSFAGWAKDETTYGAPSEENPIITANGISAGGIRIHAGGLNGGGFGYIDRGQQPEQVLTIDRVRGVLVTALAVATTSFGKEFATGFAKVAEALVANCFHPTGYELRIEAERDPFLLVKFSNGLTSVELETAEQYVGGDVNLGLEQRVLISSRTAEILQGIGTDSYRYNGGGIQVEIDGKWERIASLNTHSLEGADVKPDLATIEGGVDAEKIFPGTDARSIVNRKVVTAIIEQLKKTYGLVHVLKIDLSQYSRNGGGSVRIELINDAKDRTFSTELRG